MDTMNTSTYKTADGETLAIRDWPLDADATPRGLVLIVHGLGEHSGRYEEMAGRLRMQNFLVRSYDHYGHGLSSGARGTLPSRRRLVDDLAQMVDHTRRTVGQGLPLILLGHSMGGLVAAHAVALNLVRIDGLVLSSPALDAGLDFGQRLLLALLPALAPNLRVRNGLDVNGLSHDAEVIKAYQRDVLVHDRISPRLGRYIADAGPRVILAARQWQVPTLLLYAGQDRLVDPRGSAAFAQAAAAQVEQQLVEVHCYAQHYHEIFNELHREPVYRQLMQWLGQRFS
jgi:alpha-beta hydrolase superfamily lysophospholipase